MYRITSQVVAQGSYGIRKINHKNGTDIGHAIKVWHVLKNGKRVETWPTRQMAQEAATSLRQADQQ